MEKCPEAKFVKISDKNLVDTDDLKKLLVKNKLNYVILDTDNKRANDFVKQLIKDNNLNTVSTPSYKHLNQQLYLLIFIYLFLSL